jgi:hypothetical protein
MGSRGSFPGGKAAGAWSWPLAFIYCRGQRMSVAIPPLPQYAFMAWCLVKAQGQLYFTLLVTTWRATVFIFLTENWNVPGSQLKFLCRRCQVRSSLWKELTTHLYPSDWFTNGIRSRYCPTLHYPRWGHTITARRFGISGISSTPAVMVIPPWLGLLKWVVTSLGVKWPGREAYHSPPSGAEVK